ncbi:MAG: hypothetical protein C4326_06640 [Ignavibacteria bacterium]
MKEMLPSPIQELLARSRHALAEGALEEAMSALNAALQIDPAHQEAQQLAVSLGEAQERKRLEEIERNVPAPERSHQNESEQRSDDHYLTKAHRYFLEGEYDLALAEVTLALLCDPMNERAQQLEQEIQNAKQSGSRRISPAAHTQLIVARRFLEREKFDEALEEIEDGLRADPHDEELVRMREEILAQRDEHRRAEKEQQRHALLLEIRTAFARTAFDDALRMVNEALAAFPADEEFYALQTEILTTWQKWEEIKTLERQAAETKAHIQTARDLLKAGRLDDAAAEIALGLILAPANSELKALEKELWALRDRLDAERRREEAERVKAQQEVQIKLHLLAAEEFARHGQFQRALDEIVQAYMIDPSNTDARDVEVRVRQMQQRAGASPLRLVYKNTISAQSS